MTRWHDADRRPDRHAGRNGTACQSAEWESLYRQFAPSGLRYAYSILRNHAEAEEAMQDAFCRLLSSAKWRGPGLTPEGFGAVLFTTIRRLAIDVMRRRRRSQGHLAAVEGSLSAAQPPAGEEAGHEVLYQLIDQLPPSWKDALHMRVMGGLTYLEISRALHCTPAQVRTWLYRARRQLADQLRSRGGLNEAGVNHVRLS